LMLAALAVYALQRAPSGRSHFRERQDSCPGRSYGFAAKTSSIDLSCGTGIATRERMGGQDAAGNSSYTRIWLY